MRNVRRSAWFGAAWATMIAGTVACGAPPGPGVGRSVTGGANGPSGAGASTPGTSGVLATSVGSAAGPPCTPAHTDGGSAERTRGIDAFARGDFMEARAAFRAAQSKRPDDRASTLYGEAVDRGIRRRQTEAYESLRALAPVKLAAAPPPASSLRPVPTPRRASLVLRQDKVAPNLVVDVLEWAKAHGLTLPIGRADGEGFPDFVPMSIETVDVTMRFTHPDHDVAIYGDEILVVFARGKVPRMFDLRDVREPKHSVSFARLTGDVLLLALGPDWVGAPSARANGVLAAYDATSGAPLWVSEPRVSNAGSVMVTDAELVAGYGASGEPDFLRVLSLADGTTIQKLPLATAPEAILPKDGVLYVRAYDKDYEFRPDAPFGAPKPPALLDAPSAGRAHDAAAATCHLRSLAALLDARKDDEARTYAEAFRGHELSEAGRVVSERLAPTSGKKRLDLSTKPLRTLAAPPWAYTVPKTVIPPNEPVPVLTLGALTERQTLRIRAGGDPSIVAIPPFQKGKSPATLAENVPSRYGDEDLRAIILDGDLRHLVYGGRFVVGVRGEEVLHAFDFEAFRHPPKTDPRRKEFAIEDVTYVRQVGPTLYVCNGGGSYAKEVAGKKGFLSAIDVPTGELVWRSDPLVCNSTFVVEGNYLLTGYGFTDEPDFVFALRRSDGKIVQKKAVASAPSRFMDRHEESPELVHYRIDTANEAYALSFRTFAPALPR
ncbi:MAG: hypothetical protein U0169_05165 [Polyangiaceae bacterium]